MRSRVLAGLVLTLMLPLAGCSYVRNLLPPPVPDAPDTSNLVYEMPVERARQLAGRVMNDQFPGRTIKPLPSPAIGYATEFPLLVGSYNARLSATPVAGRGAGGSAAVRFEVEESGRFVEREFSQSLRRRLVDALQESGAKRVP